VCVVCVWCVWCGVYIYQVFPGFVFLCLRIFKVQYVNEGQRAAERLEKLLEIQRSIHGMKNPEHLISASRTYCRESDMNLLLKKVVY